MVEVNNKTFLKLFIRWLEYFLLSVIYSSIFSMELWELLEDKNCAFHAKALGNQLMFSWNDWLIGWMMEKVEKA